MQKERGIWSLFVHILTINFFLVASSKAKYKKQILYHQWIILFVCGCYLHSPYKLPITKHFFFSYPSLFKYLYRISKDISTGGRLHFY